MSDPPRLRDLADDDFSRALLRSAEPTRALGPEDALRLQPAVAKIAATPTIGALFAAKYGAHALVLLGLASSGVLAARALRTAPVNRPAPVVPAAAPATSAIDRRAQPVIAAPLPPRAVEPPAPAIVVAPPAPVPSAPPTAAPRPRRASPPPAAVVAPPAATAAAEETREATLSEELAVMREARALLTRDPNEAERVLAGSLRALRGGQLRHDREALRVESLLRAGRRSEAEAQLRALEAAAPGAPSVARLRALLRDTP